ncbi:MAG: bifunctional [glutamate--ammonia ligase]-adenylyl-L-tyrosine phosphorylase/[glutamate--ammonia-ligase] adenylyltransferase [Magnetococcales bacterium]|nr:bifunctional [glutamate--ammonia ligase]-adenylyl-L-tyrosine phosphorylase/[glutamate--ammonia-ligase] adenylyltransferase [Magnetococcales bacterium]
MNDSLAMLLNISKKQQNEWSELIQTTADPKGANQHLESFINAAKDHSDTTLEVVRNAFADKKWQRRLSLALGNSIFLSHLLKRWPQFLAEIFDDTPVYGNQARRSLLESMKIIDDKDQVMSLIRVYKQRAYLQLGMLDLAGEMPVMAVTQGLSDLADDCLEAGYRWLNRTLSQQHGQPMVQTGDKPPRPARFVILGMGKLGGGELNFSSDVDLIYLYDSDKGETNGKRKLNIKTFYSKLGRELMRLLMDRTAEGMAFRLDLRLRPEGETGDLCLSIRSAEIYYESWGRTWERAAMIKARPVAGDLALGNQFIASLKPFIYRRSLDYPALQAIRDMKRMVDKKVSAQENYHHNVKLGYGGIREIEFFAQSLQLIHAGTHEQLQTRSTLEALETLRKLGLIDRETASHLNRSYRFLRTVEHRLQIVREEQTHVLPRDAEKQLRLARRMGYDEAKPLFERIKKVTDKVHTIYDQLFHGSERQSRELSNPLVEEILSCNAEQCPMLLKQAGFENPEQAQRVLEVLRKGPRKITISEKAQHWYDQLAPLVIHEILKAPDQTMALGHMEAFLVHIGSRHNYLATLVENPPILALLVRLFGASSFLSQYFINHPEMMDNFLSWDYLNQYRQKAELVNDLVHHTKKTDDDELFLDALRDFKNSEILRIGAREMSGIAELDEAMSGLSSIADALLTRVLFWAKQTLIKRHGHPCHTEDGETKVAPFGIIALGKLGGSELNYASDLDLIMIHGSQGDNAFTDGKNSISNSVFFNKLGQKVVTGITATTRAGRLYELDMRLRPSGNSGPLVTSFEAFRNYQRSDAWNWEHQALTRARVVVADPGFYDKIKNEINEIITFKRDPEKVRVEVDEMRRRMHQEKKAPGDIIDIKQTRGGIVDVEFLVQYLILAYGRSHKRIVQTNVGKALFAFKQVKLLTKAQFTVLDDAYRFYRLVENRLRLLHNRSENRLAADPVLHRRMERLCNLSEESPIRETLRKHFSNVSKVYTEIMNPDITSDS